MLQGVTGDSLTSDLEFLRLRYLFPAPGRPRWTKCLSLGIIPPHELGAVYFPRGRFWLPPWGWIVSMRPIHERFFPNPVSYRLPRPRLGIWPIEIEIPQSLSPKVPALMNPRHPLSSNFSHLQAHDEQFLRPGMLAERYFADDSNTCLLKLRQLAQGRQR